MKLESGWGRRGCLETRRAHLQQVEDVGRVQPVVTQAVQQLHLGADGQLLEGALSQGVGLTLLQLPAVVDDVIEVPAEGLGAARDTDHNNNNRVSIQVS